MLVARSEDIERLREERRARGEGARPVEITIRTWVPEKYLLVDLETGDVWQHDEVGRPRRYEGR